MKKHHHNHHSSNKTSKNIFIAFLLNFMFSIFEFIGGYLTGSVAIFSDAIHDLGDSISLLISLVLNKVSDKTPSKKYSMGFKRLSVIGAILNIIILSIGTFWVIEKAIINLQNPKPVMEEGMILMSIFGILVNAIAIIKMKGAKKILDRSVAMHLLEDFLGWISVLVISIIMIYTEWYIFDPILSLIISFVVLKNILINIKGVVDLIMFADPDVETTQIIKNKILKIKNISKINSINIWTIDGDEHMAMLQIQTKSIDISNKTILDIKDILKEKNILVSNVEILTEG